MSLDFKPDYALLLEDNGMIDSRWFVMECDRVRAGQYRVQLRRDVLADNLDAWRYELPAFVMRGTVSNPASPLIFQKEKFSCNQMRQLDWEIKDKTETPWIVAYIKTTASMSGEVKSTYESQEATSVADYASPAYFSGLVGKYSDVSKVNTRANTRVTVYDGTQSYAREYTYDPWGSVSVQGVTYSSNSLTYRNKTVEAVRQSISNHITPISQLLTYNFSSYAARATSVLDPVEQAKYAELKAINGQVIYLEQGPAGDTDPGFFTIQMNEEYVRTDDNAADDTLATALMPIFAGAEAFTAEKLKNSTKMTLYGTKITSITYTRMSSSIVKTTLHTTARRLKDAPYYMVCAPYGDIWIDTTLKTNASAEMRWMTKLQEIMGINEGGNFIDWQLLPYCPMQAIMTNTAKKVTIDQLVDEVDFEWLVDGNNRKNGIIFFCPQSDFTRTIDTPTNLKKITTYASVEDLKLSYECDLFRLCSSNYSSTFEFSPALNASESDNPSVEPGYIGIKGFEIKCTYKPFQPYIHVAPIFDGYYGKSYRNDFRGLIVSGDYSLPMVNDAWVNYELNNKNYLATFDRQQQNLETLHGYERIQNIVSVLAGTAQGAGSGAAAGGLAGGFTGAMIGGTIGAGFSLAAGATDIALNEKIFAENQSYRRDMFDLQLDNIKAMPNTLARVNAINIMNHIFPFVEYYTCSNEEKALLQNKLQYEGFTIGVIDNLANYLAPHKWIQAQPIIQDGVEDDTHMLNEISSELQKGVYVEW